MSLLLAPQTGDVLCNIQSLNQLEGPCLCKGLRSQQGVHNCTLICVGDERGADPHRLATHTHTCLSSRKVLLSLHVPMYSQCRHNSCRGPCTLLPWQLHKIQWFAVTDHCQVGC